jgi:hypothetical protein
LLVSRRQAVDARHKVLRLGWPKARPEYRA